MYHHKQRLLQASIITGLSFSLMAGTVLAPQPALAETGTITIRQRHNQGATYDAYLLFTAHISPEDKATNIQWASESMQRALLAFIDENGYREWLAKEHPGESAHDNAQVAAEFIGESIGGSPTDVGAATTPRTTAALSFYGKIVFFNIYFLIMCFCLFNNISFEPFHIFDVFFQHR